jgi:hypothetical protein
VGIWISMSGLGYHCHQLKAIPPLGSSVTLGEFAETNIPNNSN